MKVPININDDWINMRRVPENILFEPYINDDLGEYKMLYHALSELATRVRNIERGYDFDSRFEVVDINENKNKAASKNRSNWLW